MRKILSEQSGDDMERAVAISVRPETAPMPDFAAITKDMDHEVGEPEDKEDVVVFGTSALIRMMEHCREDFGEGEDADTELHEFAEMLIELAEDKDGEPISVEDLEEMFEEEKEEEEAEEGGEEAGEGGEEAGEGEAEEGGEEGGEEGEEGGEEAGEGEEGGEEAAEGVERDEDAIDEAKKPGKTVQGSKTTGVPSKIDNSVGKGSGMKKAGKGGKNRIC